MSTLTPKSAPTITLVTGGSRGLGRNTAEHVARAGGDVILTYRSGADEAAAAVAAIQALGRKAVALQLDIGKVATFAAFAGRVREALASQWQRDSFDHLVNNAGHGDTAPLAETTEAQFDRLVDVHFKGVFFLTQALLPLLADGGRIVNFSSGLVRDNAEVNRQLAAITALGRVGEPDDIGPMVASLLSPSNRWVTAQRIEVSGGQAI
ncbi:SDR family NAD(P)-dependent oxidoreductase [Pseudoxanthomonas kaohsiungensis]|uniref:SDR family NAD(P)-dependent oxidoreductase n=1 Tax=Pseudoxanthomonas kaohsiungensis TaxID=283923 RepID=UPI0035AED5CF